MPASGDSTATPGNLPRHIANKKDIAKGNKLFHVGMVACLHDLLAAKGADEILQF